MPPPFAGTTVLFRQLAELLAQTPQVECEVINVAGIRVRSIKGIIRLVAALVSLFRFSQRVDVVTVHVHLSSMHKIVPFCLLFAGIFRKPLVIRQFGGIGYYNLPPIRAKIDHWLYSCSTCCLFELKMIACKAKADGIGQAAWYSNSRFMSAEIRIPRDRCRKFVYVGHIKPSKGVFEILQAADEIGSECSVDFYGPFDDGLSREVFEGHPNVQYCGVLDADEVIERLSAYDALLLPSYHWGEGYPGVVLEAYSAGLPVICSRWQGLPEIVDDSCGILVEPRSAESLRIAMHELIRNTERFRYVQEGVTKRRLEFSAELWRDRFIDLCKGLVE
jgi:glycosyltransferase involved in cell wall biosynthesis